MATDLHLGSARISTYSQALAEFERDTIRQVNHDMRGQEVSQVHAALGRALRGRFPGVDFGDAQLRTIATAISKGTLRD